MFINMTIVSFEMLLEHDLMGKEPVCVKNAGILAFLLLDFMKNTLIATELEVENIYEIVRAADKAGVKLEPRKEVKITEEDLALLREQCKGKNEKKMDWKKEVSEVRKCSHVDMIWDQC
jgi:hypothetical protein